MPVAEECDVLIVGAGPAGAALALLLSRAGVGVTLIERERDFARVFRGEGLMPSGVDALVEMGLGEALARLPGRRLESWDLYIDRRPTMSVAEPMEELGERAVRVVSQPALLNALVDAAAKQPGFHFEPGVTLRDLLRHDGRVVGARVQDDDGAREIRARLVVGCDGRASAVRKRAEIALALSPEGYDVLWFKLPPPERLRDGCRFQLMATATHMAAAYTSWDGRLQFALTLPKGAYKERRGSDWPEEMAVACPGWLAEHVRAHAADLEGPVLLDVIVGRAPEWSAPGVLLIGDAAHPMAPIRAQGINHALRDAVVTANHLVPALSDPRSDLVAACQAVQAAREPEVARCQHLQHLDTAGWNKPYTALLLRLGKTLGGWLGRYGWAQRAWLRQQHDLRFGTGPVRLDPPPRPTRSFG